MDHVRDQGPLNRYVYLEDTLARRVPGSPAIYRATFTRTRWNFDASCWGNDVFRFYTLANPEFDVIFSGEMTDSFGYWEEHTEPRTGAESGFLQVGWGEMVSSHWKTMMRQRSRPPSSLKAIVFQCLQGSQTLAVFQQIFRNDPNVKENQNFPGFTTVVRFVPEDDNFYALLGTLHGRAVAHMLTHHAGSFATRAAQDGDAQKVKTIRDIQITAGGLRRGPLPDSEALKAPFEYLQMLITLQDVDPPPADAAPAA